MKKNLLLLLLLLVGLSAQAQNRKLLDSLQKVYKNTTTDTTRILLQLAIAGEYINSNPDTCIYLANQALTKSQNNGFGRGRAMAYNAIGSGFINKSQYVEALLQYQQALAVFKKMQDKKGVALSLNNLGNAYFNQSDYPQALAYYQDALKLREEIKDKPGIAQSLNNIGIIYKNQGNYALGLENYQKSLKIKEEIGDRQGIALTLNNIAGAYEQKKAYTLAEEYYQRSLKIREEAGNKRGMSNNYNGLAKVAQKQQDFEKSVTYGLKGLQIAQEIKALKEVKDLSKTLFETYKLKQDFANALVYHELYKQSNDSIFNLEKSKTITNLETKVKLNKKDLEFLKEKEAKEFQQKLNYLTTFSLLVVLVFAYFIFRSRQKEKKSKELLLQQKEEIQQINEELELTLTTLNTQKTEIEEKNQAIQDSIVYAQRIQQTILPLQENIQAHLPDHFIFFQPQGVVSGDFYYFEEKKGKLIVAVIDCTGHGVPGAFMAMIASEILNEIIQNKEILEADLILNELHKRVRIALKQDETNNQDGMDVALLVIDKSQKRVSFAGAKRPLIYIQQSELFHLKGDGMPIGGEQLETERMFVKHTIELSIPTIFYLFTDGYQDQFGGVKKKKFKLTQMKEMLLSVHAHSLPMQRQVVAERLQQWMNDGNERQIDDVLVVGVQLG